MAIKVREAMTPGVRWVAPTDSVNTAATMMRDNDVGSLPIVDDGQLVGIITDRDIVMRAVALGAATDRLSVGEIASREVLTARPDQDLADAAQLMARGQVRRLPVVEDGRLVGLLAQADVAVVADEKQTGEMLEEISQPSSTARA